METTASHTSGRVIDTLADPQLVIFHCPIVVGMYAVDAEDAKFVFLLAVALTASLVLAESSSGVADPQLVVSHRPIGVGMYADQSMH